MPEQVEPCPPEALTDDCWEGVEMADPGDTSSRVFLPTDDVETLRRTAPETEDPADDGSLQFPVEAPQLEGPELVFPSDVSPE